MSPAPSSILITIDVEDWFQVENFKPWIPLDTWSSRDLRVETNVCRLLDLFDEVGPVRATFFVLGWIAEKVPSLVREIHNRGHEVASHGYGHHLCTAQTPKALREDLQRSKSLLEQIIGAPVTGYRAPSFSISETTLDIIAEAGFAYDSSYNSFRFHGRYGGLPITGYDRKGIALRLTNTLWELPVSNLTLRNQVFPLGGGGYFRLIPFPVFKKGVSKILGQDGAYLFYAHPWEIDPDQPRVSEAGAWFRFRHYLNLSRTEARVRNLLSAFSHCRFATCRDYLSAPISD